jgi:hypothetical protein
MGTNIFINVGLDMGHNHVFAREIKRIGLAGKPTVTFSGPKRRGVSPR